MFCLLISSSILRFGKRTATEIQKGKNANANQEPWHRVLDIGSLTKWLGLRHRVQNGHGSRCIVGLADCEPQDGRSSNAGWNPYSESTPKSFEPDKSRNVTCSILHQSHSSKNCLVCDERPSKTKWPPCEQQNPSKHLPNTFSSLRLWSSSNSPTHVPPRSDLDPHWTVAAAQQKSPPQRRKIFEATKINEAQLSSIPSNSIIPMYVEMAIMALH